MLAPAGVARTAAATTIAKLKRSLIELVMNLPPMVGSEWVSPNQASRRMYSQDRVHRREPIPYGSGQQWALRALQWCILTSSDTKAASARRFEGLSA